MFVVLAGGESAARLLAFLTTAVLARRLGAASFGLLSVAMAVRLYLNTVVEGGVDSVGMREASVHPTFAATVAPALLVIRLVVAIGVALVGGLAALAFLPEPEGALIAAYGLSLLPFALNVRWLVVGLGNAIAPAVARLTGEALILGAVLLFLREPGDVAGMPLIQFAGEAAAALVLAGFVRRLIGPLPRTAWSIARPYFRESRQLVVHAWLGLVIFNADLLLVRLFRTPTETGQYAAAYTIIGFLVNLGVVYYQSLLPALSHQLGLADSGRGRYAHALEQVLLAAIPLAVGGAVIAGPLMRGIFGDGYIPSAAPFAILVASIPASWLRNVAQAGQVASRRSDALVKTSAVAAALNLGLNLWLIPRYGLTGAATATLGTEVIRTVIALGWSRALGLPFPSLRLWWRPVLAAGVMYGGIKALGGLPVAAVIVAGGLIYLLALAPIGGLRRLVRGDPAAPLAPN